MTAPRFQKGQMVVIHGMTVSTYWNGFVARVAHMQFRPCHHETKSKAPLPPLWVYWLSPHPEGGKHTNPISERRLRPYDPPSTWDHEDSVFKPEALKDRTGETA